MVRTEPGRDLARFIKALAASRGDILGAQAFAEAKGWATVAGVCKALVDPVTAQQTGGLQALSADVVGLLRPLTVVGRLAGVRRVPFAAALLRQDVGGSGDWVGEGQPIPVSAVHLESIATLSPKRVAGIRVLSAEVLRLAVDEAEATVARDAVGAVAEAADTAFLDPANNGTALKPASITAGAQAYSSTGSTVSAIDADLAKLIAVLVGSDCPLSTAAWIMAPGTAVSLSLLRGSGGAPAYPTVTARGGTLLGLPVLTSSGVKASGSPGEKFIALVEAAEIDLADDGQAEVDLSTKAAVQMNDAPSAGAQQLTSLWQAGLVGIRVQRYMNWRRRRDGAVAVLRDVTF